MGKQLTNEIINHRLIDKPFVLISHHLNTRTKDSFQCKKGHIFKSTFTNAIRYKKCPKCRYIYGVALNDSTELLYKAINGKVVFYCPYYRTWTSMLQRVYGKAYLKNKPTYVNVSICSDWLIFSNFKNWMKTQNWKNKHLDKDVLVPGNTVYSPNTCCFVSNLINSAIGSWRNTQQTLGYYFKKSSKKYIVSCNNINNKKIQLGSFDNKEDARKAYIKFKSKTLTEIKNNEPNEQIKIGIQKHINLLTLDFLQ